MNLNMGRFGEFYSAVNGAGKLPFPWQQRVADRVGGSRGWPQVIALPTAAGKTTCIDIAVFSLACGISEAPRRIFSVVDRRVIVDQTYDHALKLAAALKNATGGILKEVADALMSLGGDDRPLDVYSLRGGMYREDTWIRSPAQPTIVSSTVDQIGSRLLFRGYGVSPGMAPIHAGLVGNDSLILVDEAHCSKPFCDTLSAVAKYRLWNTHLKPFAFVALSATPDAGTPNGQIEKDEEEDRRHPILGKRISASKIAKLLVSPKESAKSRGKLIETMAKEALSFIDRGARSVGCIVNRVATARDLAARLMTGKTKVVLITGRMRSVDRDKIYADIEPLLAGKTEEYEPVIVVSTQCLEVGADLDFHGLVAEASSLDSLRQRFGRLNRIAARAKVFASVVIRADQIGRDDDPIYGKSLSATWEWLNAKSIQVDGQASFDFGTKQTRESLAETSDEVKDSLNVQASSAPVMFPAHLDSWVQTSPIPVPDPNVSLFLHGPARAGIPDVQVVFRDDLGEDDSKWAEIVSLIPPTSSESLPVRINVFKEWMSETYAPDESADIEGGTETQDAKYEKGSRKALAWANSQIVSDPNLVRPNLTYIVPCGVPGIESLGDSDGKDYAEQSYRHSRDRIVLRLSNTNLDPDDDEFEARIEELIKKKFPEKSSGKMLNGFENVLDPKKRRWSVYQQDNRWSYVVYGTERLRQFDPTFDDEFSTESSTRREITLDDHTANVIRYADKFSSLLELPAEDANLLSSAGSWHDIGKADPRFQGMLQGRSRHAIRLPLLAKSASTPISKKDRETAREIHGLPCGARHELLSAGMVERLSGDDLLLHLIATHHGMCRPFAPPMNGGANPPQADRAVILGQEIEIDPREMDPAIRNRNIPNRFWRVIRQKGWWGAAYLESVFRLADQAASRHEQEWNYSSKSPAKLRELRELHAAPSVRRPDLSLFGINGSNPLGFMAALGLLQFLNEHAGTEKSPAWLSDSPMLYWKETGNGYSAVLSLSAPVGAEDFLKFVSGNLIAKFDLHPMAPAIDIVDSEKFTDAGKYLAVAERLTPLNRRQGDWISSLMSEINFSETPFGQIVVVRRDNFSENIKQILALTKIDHIRRTLFEVWDYADGIDGKSLHWEPSEDRRHAYQLHRPTSDSTRKKCGGMLGANRLAIEYLPLLLSIPKTEKLATRGFRGLKANDTSWMWPLWAHPTGVDSVISLLSSSDLHSEEKGAMSELGVFVRFRSGRILNGKTPNITQSRAV